MRKWFVPLAFVLAVIALGNSEAAAQIFQGFRNVNYQGTYVCKVCSGSCFFTATQVLTPSGAGAYSSGVQTVYGTDGSFPSQGCSYTLNTSTSSYSINRAGIGTETLNWQGAAANPGGCPGNYQDQTSIVLSGLSYAVNPFGVTQGTKVADNNLGDVAQPGTGECTLQ